MNSPTPGKTSRHNGHFALLMALAMLVGAVVSNAQPIIPRAIIPHDIDTEISTLIERLYSTDAVVRASVARRLVELRRGRLDGDLVTVYALPFLMSMFADDTILEMRSITWPGGASMPAGHTSPSGQAKEALSEIDPEWRRSKTAWKLVPYWIESLRAKPSLERLAAVRVLGEIKCAQALDRLLVLLKDDSGTVQCEAARVLGELGDPKAVEPLIAAYKKGDANFKIAIIEALRKSKDTRAVPTIIAALKEQDPYLQSKAIAALGEMADPRAVEPLLAMLDGSSYKSDIARALGFLRDPRAVNVLMTLAKDPDVNVRTTAMAALGGLRDPRLVDLLIAALGDREWCARKAAACALGETSDSRAVEPLVAALAKDDIRGTVADALGKIKDVRSIDGLIAVLNSDVIVLRSIEGALMNIENPRTVERLLAAALKDRDRTIRQRAMEVLAQKKDPGTVGPLISLLNQVNDRDAAAYALGEIRDSRAVEPLITALKDRDPYFQRAAARALGMIEDPRAVEPLIKLLSDPMCRRDAIWALRGMRSPHAVTALIAVVKDGNGAGENQQGQLLRDDAFKAMKALGEMNDSRSIDALFVVLRDCGGVVQRYAVNVMVKIKDPLVVESAIALLKHESIQVRSAAAELLGGIKDPRAIDALAALLKDGNWILRANATFALGNIGDPLAVTTLMEALTDCNAYIRESAAAALGKIGDPRAVEALTFALKDASKSVQLAARWSLWRIEENGLDGVPANPH